MTWVIRASRDAVSEMLWCVLDVKRGMWGHEPLDGQYQGSSFITHNNEVKWVQADPDYTNGQVTHDRNLSYITDLIFSATLAMLNYEYRQSVNHVGSGLDVTCYQAHRDWFCGWEYELLSTVCTQVSTWVYIAVNDASKYCSNPQSGFYGFFLILYLWNTFIHNHTAPNQFLYTYVCRHKSQDPTLLTQ